MKMLKVEELAKVSGGYESTSISMTFNIPLSIAPDLAQSFPNVFLKKAKDLNDFINAVKLKGLDPAQIQVEVYIYQNAGS